MSSRRGSFPFIACALWSAFLFSSLAVAQVDPALEQGIKPFGTYSGDNLDSVSLTTAKLNVHIPLWSFPQRGGKLHLNYSLHFDGPSFTKVCVTRYSCQWKQPDNYLNDTGTVALINDVMPQLNSEDIYDSSGDLYLGTSWTVMDPDGAVHLMGAIPTAGGHGPTKELRSVDATGYYADISNWQTPKLYDSNGIRYTTALYTQTALDTNGNQIRIAYRDGTITDSIGRIVPLSPNQAGNLGLCSGGATTAKAWNVPGQGQGQVTLTFCYNSHNQIQNVVLPNASKYTFEYEDFDDYVAGLELQGSELKKVTLPTGGTISYAWVTAVKACGQSVYRAVTTRTISPDGQHNYQWTYNSGYRNVTVTDPTGASAVHTLAPLYGACDAYIGQYQQYDAHGALLKTVTTDYWSVRDPGPRPSAALSVVPKSVTTTWPNGQQSQRSETYVPYFTFVDYAQAGTGQLGNAQWAYFTANPYVVTDNDYAGGHGTLRTTKAYYMAFPNNDGSGCSGNGYCSKNLLNLEASAEITDPISSNDAYTTYGYDPGTGNQTSVHRRLNLPQQKDIAATMSYTSNGMVQYSRDPLGNQTNYAYDGTGLFLSAVTDALQHQTQYNYDKNTGVLNSVTDPNHQTTVNTYDAMNRLLTASYPDGGSTQYRYNDTASPVNIVFTQAIDPQTITTETALLDGLGRPTQTQLNSDPEGVDFVDIAYDGLGRRASVSNPYRSRSESTYGVTSYQYDTLGRLLKQTQPDAGTIVSVYSGSWTTVTDEAGKARTTLVDALGHLTDVWEDPSGLRFQTHYSWDCLSNLVGVTQLGGSSDPGQWRLRGFNYDSLSRLLRSTNPEAGTTTYVYDDAGTLTSKTDARGITITYIPDAVHRITTKTYAPGNDPPVYYCYDNNQSRCGTPGVAFGIGRRTGMADTSGNTAWSYDTMGRLAQENKTISGVRGITTYTYNYGGDITRLQYPIGPAAVDYIYGAAGRAISASLARWGNYASGVTYTAAGALTGLTNNSGAAINNIYNSRQQLSTLKATKGQQTFFSLTYDFGLGRSDNSSVYGITNNLNSARSQAFTYDSINRLATARTATCGYGNSWGNSYTIDPWGNLTQKNHISGCTNGEYFQVSADTRNRLQAQDYLYDLDGNLTRAGTVNNTFNAENELTCASTTNSHYLYDGDGRKVKDSGGASGTTLYWYDQAGHVLTEGSSVGTPRNQYLYLGGARLARIGPRDVYYYYSDHLGTPRIITDSRGTVCYDADYYPWGGEQYVATNTCPQNYKFTSKQRDPDTGADYFGARWYGSIMSRFYSPDWSATVEPVPYAKLDSPQTLNLYAYLHGNPVSGVDADGHQDSGDPGPHGSPMQTDPLHLDKKWESPAQQQPECFAQLKYRAVDFLPDHPIAQSFQDMAHGTLATHSFWYVQDSSGTQSILSAGPKDGSLGVWPPTKLADSKSDTPSAGTVFDSGTSARNCSGVDRMAKAAANWKGSPPYDARKGPNSNSAANFLGQVGGFSVPRPPAAIGWSTPTAPSGGGGAW